MPCHWNRIPTYHINSHRDYLQLPRDGLVVSMFASHTVGHGFTPRPGHTKDHNRNGTKWLPPWHAGI